MPVLSLKALFWLLLALFLLTTIGLATLDAGLQVPAVGGIIAFEFCGFTASCEQVLAQWGESGQKLALLSLGVDYLYLVIYPGLLCTGLLLSAHDMSGRVRIATRTMAWVAPLAGLADGAENYCLIQLVLTADAERYGVPAGIFATLKFALLLVSLGALLAAQVWRRLHRDKA